MAAPQNDPESELTDPISPPLAPNYTQVNILFRATEVELPSADKFNGFPPDAQKALLAAFRTEQLQRHAWLKSQQENDYKLNVRIQGNDFQLRLASLGCATLLAIVFLLIGAWLIHEGAPAIGVAMLTAAITSLVGTAIYGHKALSADKKQGVVQQEKK